MKRYIESAEAIRNEYHKLPAVAWMLVGFPAIGFLVTKAAGIWDFFEWLKGFAEQSYALPLTLIVGPLWLAVVLLAALSLGRVEADVQAARTKAMYDAFLSDQRSISNQLATALHLRDLLDGLDARIDAHARRHEGTMYELGRREVIEEADLRALRRAFDYVDGPEDYRPYFERINLDMGPLSRTIVPAEVQDRPAPGEEKLPAGEQRLIYRMYFYRHQLVAAHLKEARERLAREWSAARGVIGKA